MTILYPIEKIDVIAADLIAVLSCVFYKEDITMRKNVYIVPALEIEEISEGEVITTSLERGDLLDMDSTAPKPSISWGSWT